MQNHPRRHGAAFQIPIKGQCGVLLVGFGQETTEHQPVMAMLDRNLVHVVDRSTSLVEALEKVKTESIELVLLDSQFTEEEVMLFITDAVRRGFQGIAFHAVGNVHFLARSNPSYEWAVIGRSVQSLFDERPDQAETGSPYISLTKKERDVVERISSGWTNLQIARDLHCSLGSVKGIVQQLFGKMGVRNRAQVVRLAFESGFRTSPPPKLSNPIRITQNPAQSPSGRAHTTTANPVDGPGRGPSIRPGIWAGAVAPGPGATAESAKPEQRNRPAVDRTNVHQKIRKQTERITRNPHSR